MSMVHSGLKASVPAAQDEMMASYTPGPWVARKAHSGIWDVFDSQSRDIVTVSGGGVWPPANEANARLIAAAPDLLDALHRIANPGKGISQKTPAWAIGIAKAAIRKAIGEA